MNGTEARKEIARIDRQIDANRRELFSRGRFNTLSPEAWQAAWDANPAILATERALFQQRGVAQDARDTADEAAAMLAARARRSATRRRRCPTCHSLLAA